MPWASMTPLDRALDPGSFGNSDPNESGFVFNVVGVIRRYSTSSGGRSGNSKRSGTLCKEMGLVRRSWFHVVKTDCISAKIVSILAE